MSEPRFWMHEMSGVLRPVIEAYLAGRPMNAMQVAAMRAYLRQWIFASVWEANPFGTVELGKLRAAIDGLTDRVSIKRWLDDAEAYGIDPL